MSALLGILGAVLPWWAAREYIRIRNAALDAPPKPRSAAVQQERDLLSLRERFATTDMSTEEFEREVEARLAPERVVETGNPTGVPATSGVAWEVHVHDAPPGSSLHLHLP